MPDTGIVDPHHHLWDLSHSYPWLQGEGKLEFQGDATPIHKNYLLAERVRQDLRPGHARPSLDS